MTIQSGSFLSNEDNSSNPFSHRKMAALEIFLQPVRPNNLKMDIMALSGLQGKSLPTQNL